MDTGKEMGYLPIGHDGVFSSLGLSTGLVMTSSLREASVECSVCLFWFIWNLSSFACIDFSVLFSTLVVRRRQIFYTNIVFNHYGAITSAWYWPTTGGSFVSPGLETGLIDAFAPFNKWKTRTKTRNTSTKKEKRKRNLRLVILTALH